jgi:Na+-transporting NADH:ubiquinone oxidoreductase subunit NqrB
MTTYWFKPKRYGYGATPTTWQGWALTLGTVVVMVAVSVFLRGTERYYWSLVAMFGFDAIALAFLFIVTRRKTDGGFRWRWGKEDRTV